MSIAEPRWSVCFVCTGNICRSPMAEVILRTLAEQRGLSEQITITSRGTGDWHTGEPADQRARDALTAAGYDGEAHRAAQLTVADVTNPGVLVALAEEHRSVLLALGADPAKVVLLTAFDPERPSDPDVRDPYYSEPSVYIEVREQIERSCRELLAALESGQLTA